MDQLELTFSSRENDIEESQLELEENNRVEKDSTVNNRDMLQSP